jgi:three-Cys-motif partner protein
VSKGPRFDQIGYWSEVKLDIVRDYASAYSRIIAAQELPKLYHVYIDGFCGAGVHLARRTGDFVPGSPLNALNIEPPFRRYFLVDLDGDKVEHVRGLVGDRDDVVLLQGDCNEVLLAQVFPQVKWEDYRRGLCLLDPYGLDLDWRLIKTAGEMRTIDLFLNFPIMDMNRNVLWHDPEGVMPEDAARLTRFWGDDSWRKIAYRPSPQLGLFGTPEVKVSNEIVVEAFRRRLQEVAGFKFVPEPLAMTNSIGSVVYYLFFASQKGVAANIIKDIFYKHSRRGA